MKKESLTTVRFFPESHLCAISRSSFVRTFASDVIPATLQAMSLENINMCLWPQFSNAKKKSFKWNHTSSFQWLTHWACRSSQRRKPRQAACGCCASLLLTELHRWLECPDMFQHGRSLPWHIPPGTVVLYIQTHNSPRIKLDKPTRYECNSNKQMKSAELKHVFYLLTGAMRYCNLDR